MQKCKKLYRGLDMRILTCYNNIMHPGIAKLVSRLVWDQETVRSSRTTRTNEKGTLKLLISESLFLFNVYCDVGSKSVEFDGFRQLARSGFIITRHYRTR